MCVIKANIRNLIEHSLQTSPFTKYYFTSLLEIVCYFSRVNKSSSLRVFNDVTFCENDFERDLNLFLGYQLNSECLVFLIFKNRLLFEHTLWPLYKYLKNKFYTYMCNTNNCHYITINNQNNSHIPLALWQKNNKHLEKR